MFGYKNVTKINGERKLCGEFYVDDTLPLTSCNNRNADLPEVTVGTH